jgi:glycosyltransferase involved in cell wall biosynthesis
VYVENEAVFMEAKVKYNGISVILPALNEEANIGGEISEIVNYLNRLGINGEIIVVNDGSCDGTAGIVTRLAIRDKRIALINHERNIGYGASIRDGVEHSQYELVFFTDADRQFDIKSLDIMLPLMNTGVMDIIVGYRLNRKDSFLRKFLSIGFNGLVGFLFDLHIHDIDCAFKLFKRDIFSKIKIESNKFFVNTEILAKARYFGFNILEVGVPHFPRVAGKSTIAFKYISLTLRELWRIWKQLGRMRSKGRDENTSC